MTKSRVFLLVFPILTTAVLLLGACSAQSVPIDAKVIDLTSQMQVVPVDGGGTYTDVSAAGLAAMLEVKDFQLINVHVPYAGEIAGTDLIMPFDAIEREADALPINRDRTLVVYCRSGSMSAIAVRTLVQLGYTNVWNLDGGMIAWEQAGLTLQGK